MAKVSEYLTIRDAAEHLGVSKDTLRRWDRAKKLVARRNPMKPVPPVLEERSGRPAGSVGQAAAEGAGQQPKSEKSNT